MKNKSHNRQSIQLKVLTFLSKSWGKAVFITIGAMAVIWFLIRVIPKPSRASYPCQRAAFPLASAFVIWIIGMTASMFGLKTMKQKFGKSSFNLAIFSGATIVVLVFWLFFIPSGIFQLSAAGLDEPYVPAKGFDFQPDAINKPIGIAKGINPGRVVWAHDPLAATWKGHWKDNNDQWWLDKNTNPKKVANMLSLTIRKLTSTNSDEAAWNSIFKYYNKTKRNINRGYQPGEVVAIKPNLNNSLDNKSDNLVDVAPQTILAMVQQLVNHAHVRQQDIIIYDVRRYISPVILTMIWSEFKDVRFIQEGLPKDIQPINPGYGDHTGLLAADWVEGIHYSKGEYKEAKLMDRRVKESTYLVNLAMIKTHSYPYNYMEDGDEGQAGTTMCGKNHFGSIKAPYELHSVVYSTQKKSWSPLVDLALSPNLGSKTILFVLDGLYAGRKWRSYPLHFPNPPFNNKTVPYENSEWPSSVLASLDGVALESVGLDIMHSQTKNNFEPTYHNVPRIAIRDNADDFLKEMALADNPPSGTKYIHDGIMPKSLGVLEHWDNDLSRKYSRNLNPKKGKGIELIYMPL